METKICTKQREKYYKIPRYYHLSNTPYTYLHIEELVHGDERYTVIKGSRIITDEKYVLMQTHFKFSIETDEFEKKNTYNKSRVYKGCKSLS